MAPTEPTDEPVTSSTHEPVIEHPEIVTLGADDTHHDERPGEMIESPAKVMRLGTMMKQLLEEVRSATLDEASRDRLRDIYELSVSELSSALSPDLRTEMHKFALPFGDDEHPPTASELQVAQAQLVGWLEGLIQGIQATLFAQQMAAQQQLANMRGQIGPGRGGPGRDGIDDVPDARPGTYL
jgi:hypothetical protein